MSDRIIDLLLTVPAVLVAIAFHEFAHGFVSHRLGDPTPGAEGRLSLNPLKHLDLVGTLCLIFVGFGWAKPVHVNPYYYKNKKGGMVAVALAGPMMNYLIAFVSYFVMGAIIRVTGGYVGDVTYWAYIFFSVLGAINLGLGTFNLIPIPPLDGSKVLAAVLPEEQYFRYMRFERYGTLLLMAVLFLGWTAPLTYVTASVRGGMQWLVGALLGL